MASARYETLYKLAAEECRVAHSEICNRLLNWTGIDPQYTDRARSTPRLERKESVWILDTTAVQGIIRQFNQDTGLADQRNLGIRGWECGLCQMVDLTKGSVCKVLPFLLSAYLYNFPFNKFVQCYLKQGGIRSAREKFFSGIEKDESIENEGQTEGIGKLLRGKVANLARMRKEIFRLVDRFQFPEVVACELYDYLLNAFGEKPTYLLPSSLAEKFKRNCKIHTLMVYGDTPVGGPQKREVPPTGYDRYEKWTIYSLFFNLYVSILNCAEKWPDYFASKPDPAMCWILITCALQDSKEIERIESDIETLSQDDLIKVYDKRIRELHDFLKPVPMTNPEGISTRDMRKLVTVGEPSVLLKDEKFITGVTEEGQVVYKVID